MITWKCHLPEVPAEITADGRPRCECNGAGGLSYVNAFFGQPDGRERYFEIHDGKTLVSIYCGPNESLIEALRQCADELADMGTSFDDSAEEALARLAIPAAIAELEGGAK